MRTYRYMYKPLQSVKLIQIFWHRLYGLRVPGYVKNVPRIGLSYFIPIELSYFILIIYYLAWRLYLLEFIDTI